MGTQLRFAFGFVAVAIVGVFMTHLLKLEGLDRSGAPDLRTEVASGLIDQSTSKRKFKPRSYNLEIDSYNDSRITLHTPAKIVFFAESFFVLDFSDLKVVRYHLSGQYADEYGGVKGQGPGELLAPTDFAVDAVGNVWICDPPNGRIAIFNPDGEFQRFLRLDGRPYRITFAADGDYFVMHVPTAPYMFESYDSENRLIARFGELVREQAIYGLALDGWIDSTADGRLLYSPLFLGAVFAYNRDGTLDFSRRLLELGRLPRVYRNSAGRRWVDRNAPYMVRSMGVAGERLIVVGPKERELTDSTIVDIYNLQDGAYLQSTTLPASVERVFGGPRGLLGSITGVDLAVWKPFGAMPVNYEERRPDSY